MTKTTVFIMAVLMTIAFSFISWLSALTYLYDVGHPAYKGIILGMALTKDVWQLKVALAFGFGLGVFASIYMLDFRGPAFQGEPYKRWIRGAKIVWDTQLAKKTRNSKGAQVTIAGVPMPNHVENQHLLIVGSTGTGKTVLMSELWEGALSRGDRGFIVDPDGKYYSQFGTKDDVVLNVFDTRTEDWSVFSECRDEYDYTRYALSIVPKGATSSQEEWNQNARLLITAVLKKCARLGSPDEREVIKWVLEASHDSLKEYVEGTEAVGLFQDGGDRFIGSVRAVATHYMAAWKYLRGGDFSIREWLEKDGVGNIYVTWKESQLTTILPLVATFVDVLCNSFLSLDKSLKKPVWVLIDELSSLGKLCSLRDALEKGREQGLRVVAVLQSLSQLDSSYGAADAETIRSCFRNLVVLGGSNVEPEGAERLSKALGKHEVVRVVKNYSRGTVSRSHQIYKDESLVTSSEILNLPDLKGFLALSGEYPICRIALSPKSRPEVFHGVVEDFPEKIGRT